MASIDKAVIPGPGALAVTQVATKRFPSELLAVSELEFPFSEEEKSKGVSITPGSSSEEIWNLLSSTGPSVVHPYGEKNTLVIEDLSRQTVVAFETEIMLHAEFMSLVDKVKIIDERRDTKMDTQKLNRTKLMNKSDAVFNDWEVTRVRCKRLEDSFYKARDDRVSRLEKALQIYKKMQTSVGVDEVLEGWVPNIKFAQLMLKQIDSLKRGLTMTPYYMMQNCTAGITGRPLFSPSELKPDLQLSFKSDPYHLSPITGTIAERMKLVYVAQ